MMAEQHHGEVIAGSKVLHYLDTTLIPRYQ